MKMIRWFCMLLALAAIATGCATTDGNTLIAENERLQRAVADRDNQINTLNGEKQVLQDELDYCIKRTEVLGKEKEARVNEAANIRRGVQDFTDNVMNSIQTYFQSAEIVTYLGGELIPRSLADGRKNLLLVDTMNALAHNGTVTGGRAYMTEAARIQYCLLRKEPEGSKYLVAAISPPLTATGSGVQNFMFDVPLAAKAGDLIGVYLPENVTIPYDDAETGDVVAVPGSVKFNGKVELPSSSGKYRRAYSFGVNGYFENGKAEAPAAEADASAEDAP